MGQFTLTKIKRSRLFTVPLIACITLGIVTLLLAAGGDNTADRELGQIDFLHSTIDFVRGQGFNLSSSAVPPGVAVDSIGGCVYVADQSNNRVLGWTNMSSLTNGATASIVIGQADQWSNQSLTGRQSISTMIAPVGVATDPSGNLYIADSGNARVVEYNDPCSRRAPFIGNKTFVAPDAFSLDPWGLATDSNGNLFVADRKNNRVLEYVSPLSTKSSVAIIGRAGGACVSPPTASTLCGPVGVGTSGANLYVADSDNNRVVEFIPNAKGSFGATPTAALVLGQPNLTAAVSGCDTGVSAATLCGPRGVTVSTTGDVYVADSLNSRVLEYRVPVGSAEPASLVIGQPDFISNAPNAGGAVSAESLSEPAGIGVDARGNLFVLDDQNFRLLEYTSPVTPTANVELGQVDFVHSTANFVDGSALGAAVSSVAVDRNSTPQHLYVVDSNNNRVLGYKDATSFALGAPADLVIGQPDLYSAACNTNGNSAPSATTLCMNAIITTFPQGGDVAVDPQGNVWVSDVGNARVLEFKAPFTSGVVANEAASAVLGAPDFVTGPSAATCNTATQTNLCEPGGLAFDSLGDLYVADVGKNRVLEFAQPGSFSGPAPQAAALVIGQGNGGNSFTTGLCNSSVTAGTPSADNLCGPIGVAVDGNNNVYVADVTNNRVLEYDNPLSGTAGTPGSPGAAGDVTADLVFGQGTTGGGTEFTTAICNDFGISPTSLCEPNGVTIDPFGSVFISDSLNNRVLGYAETGGSLPSNVTASLVFGQSVFTTGSHNNNGLSATSLNLSFPLQEGLQDGLATDKSGSLYVVDAANVRVLAYDGGFLGAPTSSPSGSPGTPTATPTATIMPTPVAGRLSVNPANMTFPKQTVVGTNGTSSAAKTISVKAAKNSVPITITSVSVSGPFVLMTPSAGATPCAEGLQLAAGSKCVSSVAFSPTSAGKGQTGTLIVISNADDDHHVGANLTGTAVAGKLSKKPKSLNFKKVTVGSTSTSKVITLTNKNTLPITLQDIQISGTDSGEFLVQNLTADCPMGPLAAGASCTVTVTFSPIQTGKQTATLEIDDDLADSPQSIKLKGTGQ